MEYIGSNTLYESQRNKLSPEEQWSFCVQFLFAYGLIQCQKEAESFPSPLKEFLLGCLAIGFVSPIPGGSVALIFPVGAISWKYKSKISDVIQKKAIEFYH